jgi:hypothetical protein
MEQEFIVILGIIVFIFTILIWILHGIKLKKENIIELRDKYNRKIVKPRRKDEEQI